MSKKRPTRAQISRAAIQRLYIAMRHLFIRGHYKPLGISGEAMMEAMLALKPEIYGTIADKEKIEIGGLLYIFQRLPIGIEECRYIKLIAKEGLETSDFKPIVPAKRRRNCYRIDDEQMYIEMTRGKSDIYDVLTHLTFLYIEAEKIRSNGMDSKNRPNRSWTQLEQIIQRINAKKEFNHEVATTYLSTLLGRNFNETLRAVEDFSNSKGVNSLFEIVYWLGKRSFEEFFDKNDREIRFSSSLRARLGHHIYGELWANNIKNILHKGNQLDSDIHVISANMHSVVNTLFAKAALGKKYANKTIEEIASILSSPKTEKLQLAIFKYARANGLIEIKDETGANISVQIINCDKLDGKLLPSEINISETSKNSKSIIVMDYAFGEQAYEVMDELLKVYEIDDLRLSLNVKSISVMGKAGILEGGKGDIMIPTAHIFEGSADNYPIDNQLKAADFEGQGLGVYEGPMITVLGTSLQNKEILRYFLKSSWKAVGLEMEGAHYQKAIQAASKIRKSVGENIQLSYAYYASDNPLETGSTLASGSLGTDGVKPTYMITTKLLSNILS
ncbi:MAG: hypothetical protein V3V00_10550 [Saprospiraceae bacterium]